MSDNIFSKVAGVEKVSMIDKFKPTRWFKGHYHEDAHFEHKGCEVFALSISKFLELDKILIKFYSYEQCVLW